MKINGKTVAEEYDLEQWNVEMSYGEVTNESSWEPGCPVPILLESEFGMKKIKLSMLAKGSGRGLGKMRKDYRRTCKTCSLGTGRL